MNPSKHSHSPVHQSSLQMNNLFSLFAQSQRLMNQLKQWVWESMLTHNDPKITQQFDRQGHSIG